MPDTRVSKCFGCLTVLFRISEGPLSQLQIAQGENVYCCCYCYYYYYYYHYYYYHHHHHHRHDQRQLTHNALPSVRPVLFFKNDVSSNGR